MNNDYINIDRAIFELRSGREIIVDELSVFHPEFITEDTFERIKLTAKLVITKRRAAAITGKKFEHNVQIELKGLSFDTLQILICGQKTQGDLEFAKAENNNITECLQLVKSAELLPTIIYLPTAKVITDVISLKSAVIKDYISQNSQNLKQVADAPLNLCDADKAKILAFRSPNGMDEHYAIIIGDLTQEPLIRIHSSCYTGDLLGSLSCDCGDQLRGAIKLMNEAGGGVIIYLMQEGRGIGLINKLRAYKLQDNGLDTVEANEFLGFDDEERSFESAASILKLLAINKIKLVTNNPKKISGLQRLGIEVTDRIPLIISHQHNKTYLQIKSEKSGHIIN